MTKKFLYKALDNEQNTIKGIVESENIRIARKSLKKEGLFLLQIQEKKKTLFSFWKTPKIIKISLEEQAFLAQQLSVLIRSNFTIEQALLIIIQQLESKNPARILYEEIREQIIMGHSFSESIKDHEKQFSEMFCTLVEAGEISGQLPNLLESLALYLSKSLETSKKIKQALIYPSIVLTLACTIVIAMMVYVIPEISSLFQQTKKELPLLTSIIIGISNFFIQYGLILLGSLFVLLIGLNQLWKKDKYKEKIQNFLPYLPPIYQLLLLIDMARFCQSLSVLSKASVPLPDGIRTVTQIIWLLPIRKKMSIVHQKIYEGLSLSEALKKEMELPKIMIHMIYSGECTNSMSEMLENCSLIMQKNYESKILLWLTLLEPLIIVGVGGIVLTIVLSIIIPILEINTMGNIPL